MIKDLFACFKILKMKVREPLRGCVDTLLSHTIKPSRMSNCTKFSNIERSVKTIEMNFQSYSFSHDPFSLLAIA